MRRRAAVVPLLLGLLCGCPRKEAPAPAPTPNEPEAVEAAGLHNVYRLFDRLYSGSGPESDEAFASLKKLGVRTVISVDGARPDLARARKLGLRYVHLPIGYDGVPREQALRIARAVRDLPGPVYLHCHHGKHRGPAAAGAALLCLGEVDADGAVAWLERAGTDPRYKGLYAAPRELHRPTEEELDRVPANFPEVAEVGGLAGLMVEVDQRWDHLELARKAGWKAPPAHPDLAPHEALQLAELYREAARSSDAKGRFAELRRWLAEAEAGAKGLEVALRAGQAKGAEKAFRRAAADCARCHAAHRDVPQAPSRGPG
jgi:protein tyrosine phosphatase (PTP) superfamily phosphohydrolase (DUF442 family)